MISPGTKLTTETLSEDGYKVVAVIGWASDWAAYQGPSSWTDHQISIKGDKIGEEQARRLFPELVNYRWRR